MSDNIPDDMTREAYRETLNENGAPLAQHAEADNPFTLASIRKALIAGIGAFASSATPLIIANTADGSLTWSEILMTATISIGAGVAFGLTTWAVPNEKTS